MTTTSQPPPDPHPPILRSHPGLAGIFQNLSCWGAEEAWLGSGREVIPVKGRVWKAPALCIGIPTQGRPGGVSKAAPLSLTLPTSLCTCRPVQTPGVYWNPYAQPLMPSPRGQCRRVCPPEITHPAAGI